MNALSALSALPEPRSPDHWRQLRTLLERSPACAAFRLKTPAPVPAPGGEALAALLHSCPASPLKPLLVRHLLTCLALPEQNAHELNNSLSAQSHDAGFYPVTWNDLFHTRWICVPVPVVQGCRGKLVHLMLGMLPGARKVRPLENDQLSSSSLGALTTALRLGGAGVLGDQDLLCWLLSPPNAGDRLTGASLGLPAALALDLLAKDQRWPPGLFATGRMDRTGKVLPVRGLKPKLEAIARQNQLFLVPWEKNLQQAPAPGTAHVASLADARLHLACFCGGIRQADDLRICALTLNDPEQFPRQFDRLPLSFFTLPALQPLLEAVRRKILAGTDGRPLGHLARCLRQHSTSLDRAWTLQDLFSPDDMLRIGRDHPAPALTWCLGMVDLCNHRGDVVASRAWTACSDQLQTAIGGADEHSFHANIRQVTERFNRYDFRPELPKSFAEALARREQVRAINGGCDDRVLGALYGTQAQNLGFCGPAHLSSLRHALERARDAFGRTFPDETPRLHNYLVYALLDAKAWDEAARTLRVYLGLPPGSGADAWLAAATALLADDIPDSPYRVATTLRLLAEQAAVPGPPTPARLLLPFSRAALQKHHHPWQLICVNLGRLLLRDGEATIAERLWQHAVTICRDNGETLRAMALLPLALLHAHGMARQQDQAQAAAITADIAASATMEPRHFKEIIELNSGRDILEQVYATRAALFPFSYR